MSDDTPTYAERMDALPVYNVEVEDDPRHRAAVEWAHAGDLVAEADATIAALRDRLKAYEDYDAAPDDASWEPPHPIFQMAQENDALRADVQRLNQFVKNSGTTLFSCETCGHGRTSKQCLWCDLAAARQRIAELERTLSAYRVAVGGMAGRIEETPDV